MHDTDSYKPPGGRPKTIIGLGAAPAIGTALNVAVIPLPMLAYLAAVDLLYVLFNIFIFAIFIQALMSWLPNGGSNPMTGLLERITAPVLTPVRRFVPPLGGLDLSALVALIGLYALRMFIVGVLLGVVGGCVVRETLQNRVNSWLTIG